MHKKLIEPCKGKKNFKNMDSLLFEDNKLIIVDKFAYFGVQFSFNGICFQNEKVTC